MLVGILHNERLIKWLDLITRRLRAAGLCLDWLVLVRVAPDWAAVLAQRIGTLDFSHAGNARQGVFICTVLHELVQAQRLRILLRLTGWSVREACNEPLVRAVVAADRRQDR